MRQRRGTEIVMMRRKEVGRNGPWAQRRSELSVGWCLDVLAQVGRPPISLSRWLVAVTAESSY